MVTGPSGRRGAGAIGCLTTLAIIGVMIYLAVQFGRPWFRYQQFHDEMKSAARYAVTLPDSVIRARLTSRADSLGLPKEAKRLTVRRRRSPAAIEIFSEYTEIVKLPILKPFQLKFKPRAEEPL